MAKNKYYAIRKPDELSGLYTDWDEVKELITGKSNVSYKGFKTEKEAKEFLNYNNKPSKYFAISRPEEIRGVYLKDWEEIQELLKGHSSSIYKGFKTVEEAFEFIGEDTIDSDAKVVYVDGSFNEENGYSGSGVAFVENGEVVEEYSFGTLDKYGERNITGEVEATLRAVEVACSKGYKSINIHYDYLGLEAWVRGWKVSSEIGNIYLEEMKHYQNTFNIKIYFTKIKAHSNDNFNDYVDTLAKKGCGVL